MALTSWQDEITQEPLTNSNYPSTNDFNNDDLANYQSTLQSFRNRANSSSDDSSTDITSLPQPKFYDEPYQPSEAQQARYAAQNRADQIKQSRIQARQTNLDQIKNSTTVQELTNTIQRPDFGQRLLHALGGEAGYREYMSREMGRQALPVINKLQQLGTKALLEGDLDTASQAASAMSNIVGQAPQYAKQAEAFMNRINEKQRNIESNTATVDLYEKAIDMTKESNQAKVSALRKAIPQLEPGEFGKRAEKYWPQIKIGDNSVTVVDQGTGEATVNPTPTVLSPKDLTPEKRQALALLGIKEQEYIDMSNKIAADKPIRPSELEKFKAIEGQVQQGTAEAVGFQRLPAAERMKGYSPGSIAANTGAPVPGMQQQAPAMQTQGAAQQQPQMQQPRPQAFPQPTSSPATTLQGRYPKPNLGPSATLPTDITVDEAKQVSPQLKNLPDSQVAAILKDPLIKQELTIAAMSNPGLMAARERIRAEAEDTKAKETARLQAETVNKPSPESRVLSRVAKDGSIEYYRGPNLTTDQVKRSTWHEAGEATEDVRDSRNYNKFWGQGTKAFDKLANATPEDFSAFNQAVNRGAYLPVNIPGTEIAATITIPGTGVALTYRQAEMWNSLVAAANASEEFTNPDKKAQDKVADVKSQLTGILASRESAINGLKSLLRNAYDQMSAVQGDKGHKSDFDFEKRFKLPKWFYETETGETKTGGAKEFLIKQYQQQMKAAGQGASSLGDLVEKAKGKYNEAAKERDRQLSELAEKSGLKRLLGITVPPVNPNTVKSLRTFGR